MLCAKFNKIGPVVLAKKSKMQNVYIQTDRQKDAGKKWSENLTLACSFNELKKKTNVYYLFTLTERWPFYMQKTLVYFFFIYNVQ